MTTIKTLIITVVGSAHLSIEGLHVRVKVDPLHPDSVLLHEVQEDSEFLYNLANFVESSKAIVTMDGDVLAADVVRSLAERDTSEIVGGGQFTKLTDVPQSYVGQAGKVVKVNPTATGLEFGVGGGGAAAFTDLTDVPAAYALQGGKFVKVKAAENGLEFGVGGGGAGAFTDLSDVPGTYVGQSLKLVRVNAAEGGLEFVVPPATLPDLSVVLGKIDAALAAPATVIVSGVGAGDLQTAIAAAADGDVIEVRTNATYSPITLPSTMVLTIRAGIGYGPLLTGTKCIKIVDGAHDHIVSGFGFTAYTTDDNNAQGAGITFRDQGSKCQDLIFHNLHFEEVTAGSAVLMSFHRSVGPDSYDKPPQPAEMSDGISFVSCSFYKACKDGTEGAALLLRGFNKPIFYGCYVDGAALNSRGFMLQNCTNFRVEGNRIQSFTGNGEGLKIDSIGLPVAVRNTGYVIENDAYKCIEGIDCDDDCDVVVLNNRCVECTDEGISIDGGVAPAIARVLAVGNICTLCNRGIYAEAGSICELSGNSCFGNTTDYSILNGYVLPGSNLATLGPARRYVPAQGVPYIPAVPGNWVGPVPATVAAALDRIAAAIGPIP
jgi:hypothetical protein